MESIWGTCDSSGFPAGLPLERVAPTQARLDNQDKLRTSLTAEGERLTETCRKNLVAPQPSHHAAETTEVYQPQHLQQCCISNVIGFFTEPTPAPTET